MVNPATPLRVVIVGADVATLTLALLFEHAGIDYVLLESCDSVPVVAGGMTLHPTVLPLLEQLSLRDDLFFFSQPMEQVLILDAEMEYISAYDWSDRQARYGAWSRFISRPEYCAMILEKLPESRVLFNKMVTSVTTKEDDDDDDDDGNGFDNDYGNDKFSQHNNNNDSRQDSMLDSDDEKKSEARGVSVECADGLVYCGHLLIGDINSDVERKLLYTSGGNGNTVATRSESLREIEDRLGSSARDITARESHYHVSGITEVLDPQRIPLLKDDKTELRLVLDNKSSLSWWAATLVDNRIAWQVSRRVVLPEKSSRPTVDFGSSFRNHYHQHQHHHEQAATASVINQISQNMMCPLGGTMAQLLNWTPQSQISCKRWDDRRAPTVPVLGQPGEDTILDALALSEVLFSMPSTRLNDIHRAFDRYHKERTSRRESAISESRELDQTLHAKGSLRRLYRSFILNCTPKYIHDRKSDEKYAYRPQATFLQRVPDYGRVQPNPSSYSRRYSSGGGREKS
ncbi:hypothetical protein BGZ99_002006 [Dissophora globulifera]|uniref:Uncharacterized protein n=1 Tax=Dissophora globulifera TaxID=979702 RepID=A0A9P6RQY0_9FUNG|nr:hypothetical protein BGZ99_002006 [Dissophora globulifera]